MGKILFVTNSFLSITSLLTFLLATLHALPLSTNSRWIVDEKGQRVKMACVNWSAHLELVVAEGLNKQPVDVISKNIRDMGFNCVRLTWPLYLATNDSLASLSVKRSFLNAGLKDSFVELQANNPSIVNLSLINAFEEVVASLARNNVMVILDNHLTKPGWCCSLFDGNGFFGDKYFNSHLWIKGLTKMATLFRDYPNVVAMSLRNELRGSRQNATRWYSHMERGAKAVHKANSKLVVLLSGLTYDTDLSFLKNKSVSLSFTKKVAFEVHRYSFSTGGPDWDKMNANKACESLTNILTNNAGFLLDQRLPLLVTEWGINLNDTKVGEKKYSNCFLSWLVEHDLDSAFWTLAGSYYIKEGEVGAVETFGLLNPSWTEVQNKGFLRRLSVTQSPLQGPNPIRGSKHNIVFHPSTGLCIVSNPGSGIQLGNCSNSNLWSYTPRNFLRIKGTHQCLKARGLGRHVRISVQCHGKGASWEMVSDSKLHLATTLNDNETVCLDVDSHSNVITTTCKCLSKDIKCDPASQWFKIADAYHY